MPWDLDAIDKKLSKISGELKESEESFEETVRRVAEKDETKQLNVNLKV